MDQTVNRKSNNKVIVLNKIKTYFSKPQNVILLLFGIVLTFTTVAPIVAIVKDTLMIHPGTIDAHLTGKASGYTIVNYVDLFTSRLARTNLWKPLWNTLLLAVLTCLISILYGGVFAFLVTRTNLKFKKYLSSIFIFPYIMPQWTLAVVWQNLFNSNAVVGTSNGLLASLFGILAPKWVCQGLFPSAVVLGLHYAPFAYILIGGIFRNMDANLEEAATILDTPKWKTMFRITLPMKTMARGDVTLFNMLTGDKIKSGSSTSKSTTATPAMRPMIGGERIFFRFPRKFASPFPGRRLSRLKSAVPTVQNSRVLEI